MKNHEKATPAFPPIPVAAPAPEAQKGPQPNATVMRVRNAEGRFEGAKKGQAAVEEEDFEALGN